MLQQVLAGVVFSWLDETASAAHLQGFNSGGKNIYSYKVDSKFNDFGA